ENSATLTQTIGQRLGIGSRWPVRRRAVRDLARDSTLPCYWCGPVATDDSCVSMIRGVNATIIVVSASAPGSLLNTRGMATTIDSPAASFTDELTSYCSVAGTCTVNRGVTSPAALIGRFA